MKPDGAARHSPSEDRSTIAGMTLRRTAFVIALAAGCGLGLSACAAPSSHGTLGILRADDGRLHAIVQMCSFRVNGITVRDVDADDQYFHRVTLDTAVTDLDRVPLPLDLEETSAASKASYEVFAWSEDKPANVDAVQFTAADLKTLDVGEVLTGVSRDEAGALDRQPEDEFVGLVKESCA